MKDDELFYKVVHRNSYGALVSCIANCTPCEVVYAQRVKASSPYGPCMVFRNAQAALAWRGRGEEVWSCKVEKPRRCPDLLPFSGILYEPHSVEGFWHTGIAGALAMEPPMDTWLVDSVTLIERVDRKISHE